MENINHGLLGKNIKVYDLKGSKSNRFDEEGIIGETLLDTNYNLERNGDPLAFLPPPNLDLFEAISLDSQFLAENEIVDYSLLVIMDIDNKVLKVGIIDYLQNFSLMKKGEYLIKKFKNLGKNPTIVSPDTYANRFFNQMKRYFVQLDNYQGETSASKKSLTGEREKPSSQFRSTKEYILNSTTRGTEKISRSTSMGIKTPAVASLLKEDSDLEDEKIEHRLQK